MVEALSVQGQGENRHVEMWKIKRLINKLENCKG
jgi:hypothetical protein